MNTPEINDGGPAFPLVLDAHGNLTAESPGMSLRDWFAGQALAGLSASHELLLSNHDLVKEFGTSGIDKLQASKAYRLADAMIAQRNKK